MNDAPAASNCWFLTGPTASGKTAVGIALARRIDAEIISLDSMAVYRGMDIGTAKPSAAQRLAVPHHLVDLIDPSEEFSVSRYLEAAQETIRRIRQRGRQVLFVGGTPLYLKALLRGLFSGPGADWGFRQEVEQLVQVDGGRALYDRVALVDPLSAARLHPHDTRRLIRALEVYRQTGQPISHLQMQFEEGCRAEDCRVFVLKWSRPMLHRRIEQRVDGMFAAGLVDEVKRLTSDGKRLGRTARQAVGYREGLEYLDGKIDLATCRQQVLIRTRRFAKRQATWFRSLSECRPLPLEEPAQPAAIADSIVRSAS